jgi:peroxiredoxin family protein
MADGAEDKMTIIAFSGDLDKTLAAFILATTAASMGMHVSIFFTFWGLNIIKKNQGSVGGKGILRRMLNLMNRGGSSRLKLSRFNMAGAGTAMMKKLMKETNMPPVDEMISMAKGMGVEFIACTTSCGVMGLDEDAFIPAVDKMAGAATYLDQARNSKINLFI